MSYAEMTGLASGLLQLAVACYALRLSWRFGTSRVGWLIFGAFAMLALFHTLLAVNPFRVGLGSGVLPDLTYGVVSVLLLTSIARLESSLKKHWQEKSESQKSQLAWESEVEAQVVELTRSNEELRRTVTRRQVETEEQRQIREEAEKTYQSLLTAAQQTEKDLLQSITTLREELAEQKRLLAVARQSALVEAQAEHRATLDEAEAEHRAALSELAAYQTAMMNGAAVALEQVRTLGVVAEGHGRLFNSRIAQVARLLQKPSRARTTATTVLRRKKMSQPLAELARHFIDSHSALQREIGALRNRLEQLTGEAPAEQAAPEISHDTAPVIESVPEAKTADFTDHLITSVTETGTEATAVEADTAHLEPADPAPVESGETHA